jgi:ribosome-binding protein aMBF1 (putative translation factor)
MKCDICKEKIEETFLGKIRGTRIGKKVVCDKCQKKYGKDVKKHL